MKPLYFGESGRALFGVYHPPTGGRERDEAVLLCNPICHEYMKTHWAFRRLASTLADSGFPVLRFDYFGCGDSAGASGDGDLAEWRRNIRTAAEELTAMSGVPGVTVVGLRLGASLAMGAVADGLAVRDLVLWNPVVTGAALMREMESLSAASARWTCRESAGPTADGGAIENLLGYPLNPRVREELCALDLRAVASAVRVHSVIMAVSDQRGEYLQLQDELGRGGVDVHYQLVADSGNWEELFSWGGRVLTTTMPQTIADILDGRRR